MDSKSYLRDEPTTLEATELHYTGWKHIIVFRPGTTKNQIKNGWGALRRGYYDPIYLGQSWESDDNGALTTLLLPGELERAAKIYGAAIKYIAPVEIDWFRANVLKSGARLFVVGGR